MNESLPTFMKVAATSLILSSLIIGLVYEALKDTNDDYHQKVNNFQIQQK